MSEINENNNAEEIKVEENNQAKEIVIDEPSTGRKILKWIAGGVAVIAAAVGGFFLGRGSKSDDDDADAENPKDE